MGCNKNGSQFIVIQDDLKNKKTFSKQTNFLSKSFRQRTINKPKVSKWKIIKVRVEINKRQKTIEKISETKRWLFGKINKID